MEVLAGALYTWCLWTDMLEDEDVEMAKAIEHDYLDAIMMDLGVTVETDVDTDTDFAMMEYLANSEVTSMIDIGQDRDHEYMEFEFEAEDHSGRKDNANTEETTKDIIDEDAYWGKGSWYLNTWLPNQKETPGNIESNSGRKVDITAITKAAYKGCCTKNLTFLIL